MLEKKEEEAESHFTSSKPRKGRGRERGY